MDEDEMRAQLLAMGFAEHQFEAYLNTGLGIVDVVAIVAHQNEEHGKKSHKVSPRLKMLFICLSLRSKAPVAKTPCQAVRSFRTLRWRSLRFLQLGAAPPLQCPGMSVPQSERGLLKVCPQTSPWEQIRLVHLVCLEHCVTRPSHCTDLYVDSCQGSLVLCKWCQTWYHVECVNVDNQAAPKWVCPTP